MSRGSQRRAQASRRARLMRWATYASVSVASLLILVKFIAWQWSGSISLLATLVDSLLDSLASLVNLFAVRHALSPADREHRFGHGKAEALAGLGQSLLIASSSCYLLYSAFERFLEPTAVTQVLPAIAVILFSLVATLGLLAFQSFVVRETGSVAIRADSLHYRSDLLVNLAVLLALGLARFDLLWVDPLIGAVIALYILRSAWGIARDALDHLMDRELPDAERRSIRRIVLAHPDVHGMHDLRTRRSGNDTFLQLHVVLADGLTLQGAHRIIDEVEAELESAFPGAEVLIHPDPVSVVGVETRQEFLR
ncbi:cation diffusion facilitator family transporter [Mangrovimicrobium sediminis]|uniref:Cation diffusion facilitator family transporter n=1 Tax=Mangrovimicrobium sediminis TaxID=2562682 RepID=A0A4Z0LUU2_9GAMM|nr:cation diffusion facilitator family transporter [Haliea sp. SAOS-164]TGD70977.1 cation diffusion facilitator family transporter [Haliea sp. SAOS-164]